MRLNLSSQINIAPVHGENLWLKGDIEWTPGLLRSALAWLSEKTGKSILKLTDKDYKDNSLGQLLDIYGSAYDVNIRVFNWCSRPTPMMTSFPWEEPYSASVVTAMMCMWHMRPRAT